MAAPTVRRPPVGPASPNGPAASPWTLLAPAVAVAAVGVVLAAGWHGTDVAASVHRILLFRRYGFTLWDGTWYGGQWTLDYSIAFAPVAATLGLPLLGLVSAGVAALSFERLVGLLDTPKGAALAAAVVFSLGTAAAVAIGQYPFLAGEAPALASIWAASRRRWPAAWTLALAAALLSPLAGAFAALAAVAWAVAHRPDGTPVRKACAVLAAVALVPPAAAAVLFPGEGSMPFQGINWLWDVAVAAGLWVLTPSRERVLRRGIALYAVALVGSEVIQSPVGVNAGRLEDCVALPLAVALLWGRRRWILLALVAVPLVLSEWAPAWGAMAAGAGPAWTQRSFYTPLDRWLRTADPGGVDGRVEAVPTVDHTESAWVAAVVPLARGWERQTDVHVDAIFYRPGALDDATYLRWLRNDGVRYVALPEAPLDFAAVAEGALLRAGVPGLRPVWRDRSWRVWEVTGSPGLAGPGASVLADGAADLTVDVRRPGSVTLRVRWNDDWRVTSGRACLAPAAGGWTRLAVNRPGVVRLAVVMFGGGETCHP